ncbi:DUF4132 domain-containing protein [Nocardia sp. NPDC055321]
MLDSASTVADGAEISALDTAAREDIWQVPQEWWAAAAPIRGLGPAPTVEPYPPAVFDFANAVASQRKELLACLDRSAARYGDELAVAGREALRDAATCTPLGAAALTLLLHRLVRGVHYAADAWILGRGPAFAAEAAVCQAELTLDWDYDTGTRSWNYLVRRLDPAEPGRGSAPDELAAVRRYLAAATEPDYRAAVDRLAELRAGGCGLAARLAASYLAPTETQWVAADLDAFVPALVDYDSRFILLTASVSETAQLDKLVGKFEATQFTYIHGRSSLFAALVRLGPDAAPAIERLLRARELDGDTVRELARILAGFPTDTAFAGLAARAEQRFVPPVLVEAAHRYPRRALRMLGPAAARSGMARHVLRSIARAHPDLVAELPDTAAYLDDDRPRATPAELPEVLRVTPWTRARAKTKQVTLANLAEPTPDGLAWLPGERAEWEQAAVWVTDAERMNYAAEIERAVASDSGSFWSVVRLFASAPDELVRPHLATASIGRMWNSEPGLRRILARFEDDAISFVTRAVQSNPTNLAHLLAPVTGAHVTTLMTRWLDGKRTRPFAIEWFDRNRAAALPALIAASVGKAGKDRRGAESTLCWLAERGHRAEIEAAAALLDPRAGAAVTALLDTDPLHRLPAKIPAVPAWLAPELLPGLALRGNGAVLPQDAARDVCQVLALCGPNGDYAGVDQIRAAADPESLAEFAWSVFELWKLADYPSKDGWVLHALGLVGDDETARRLGALIRVWPGEAGHARAVSGLDVLTALGTDVALMQLNGIAEKVKFKGLKTKAQEKVAEVAESLGLTAEQLADRLVPEFGLNADGRLVLDFGPRGFVVGFDEQLKPTVSDAVRGDDGAWQAAGLRKALPKPGPKDDPELAPAAAKLFAALKKDVRTAAADQIRRFERAMVLGRRWTAAEHRRLFVEHPLLWHLSRRLVWVTLDAEGAVTGSFRVAEDRSYADAADEPIDVAPDTLVALAHPLHLGSALSEWAEVFADYEILQPFPQLQRETYAFEESELGTDVLDRLTGLSLPTGTLLGLGRFGWERGEPMDGGVSCEMFRALGDGNSAVIDMDPGIIAGDALEFDTQKITVHLTRTGDEGYWSRSGNRPTFAALDAVTGSELLRELEILQIRDNG